MNYCAQKILSLPRRQQISQDSDDSIADENYTTGEDESNSNESEMEVVEDEIVDISNGTKTDE